MIKTLKRPLSTNTQAIQNFFQLVQDKYGGLKPFLHNSNHPKPQNVLTKEHTFDKHDLIKLTTHEISAIHIKEYYPRDIAKEIGHELSNRIKEAKNWKVGSSRGLESSDVLTIGKHAPYNVAFAQNNTNAYFDGVLEELRGNRSCNRLYPLDKLRLELDEVWPSGTGLGREDDTHRPFGAGLPRIMIGPTRWKHGFIHVDELAPLMNTAGLFSANIYLQLPSHNNDGAFQIWPLCIRSRWDWYKNALLLSGLTVQDPELQVKLRKALGEPYTICVEPGDLVLLCVQRPHAVVGFDEGVRVSLQCFIQHNGLNERLLIEC